MMQEWSPEDYKVAWICPLEVEQIAAMEMLDEEHPKLPKSPVDHNVYSLGRINGHNVVIAGLHQPGNCPAALVVTQMRMTFPALKFGLLVGIGGGVPIETDYGTIRLGHVVVSKPTGEHSGALQYDHGKAREGQFQRTGALAPPPAVLLNAAQALAVERARLENDPVQQNVRRINTKLRGLRRFQYPGAEHDHLFPSQYIHLHQGVPCAAGCDLSKRVPRASDDDESYVTVHRGNIASGELVVKDALLRDALAQQHGLLCFEMEAAGAIADFPCIIVRGISDYCDSHKNDQWHGYAAAVAAAYARQLFFHMPVDEAQRRPALERLPDSASSELISSYEGLEIGSGSRFSAKSILPNHESVPARNFFIPRKPVNKPGRRVHIAVFGMTGTGKTSFIKTLAGEAASQLRTGHDLESCTQEIETVDFRLDGHDVTLIDTPGFGDSKRSDTEILKLIAEWLGSSYEGGKLLSGIIYLHRISDVRMPGSSIKNLRMFRKLCGAENMSKVCLLTTMWDKVTVEDGLSKERELKGLNFWGDMIAGGSIVKRHDRGIRSAQETVRSMLGNNPTTIKLQDEIRMGKTLIETDAGISINEEILRLQKQYEDDLNELKEEMGLAMAQGNQQLQARLQSEHAKIVSELGKQAEDRDELAQIQIGNLKRQWQDAASEMEKRELKLRASAAEDRERRIIAEREREQAKQLFAEKGRDKERFEQASSARELATARGHFEPVRERGGYEKHSRRREPEGGCDRPNTVKARPNSAPLTYSSEARASEMKRRPEKYNGQPYKKFYCYNPRKFFGGPGCGRPFDVVNPQQGKIQCCYCRTNWKIWGNGRLI